MKIDAKVVQFIENVITTAQKVGIEDVIIERQNTTDALIRAIDDKRTVVLNHVAKNVNLPFESIGLSRINILLSRFQVAKSQSDFSVDVDVHDSEGYVRSMLLTGKGVKIDFRCANPKTIQAPKTVNDTVTCIVPLPADAVVLLQKAQSAMGAENVTIISNSEGVSFELYDVNSDKFTHTFNTKVESINGGDTKFANTYPLKIILPLFKENAGDNFGVGQKGIMNIQMNNINLYVIPQVG
jgi:hypothetical protein